MSSQQESAKQAELLVVGTGINFGQMTLESRCAIERADLVLSVVPNGVISYDLQQLNPRVESMMHLYGNGRTRAQTYAAMCKRMIEETLSGKRVCTVFYGHPGVFVTSSHAAIRYLKQRGVCARMLPGVSAEDCLYADLGIDPSDFSIVMHEATAFLFSQRPIDPNMAMILWQIGIVGECSLTRYEPGPQALQVLRDVLLQAYPAEHQACLYEAATLPGFAPTLHWFALRDLAQLQTKSYSTLYIPALDHPEFAAERLPALGLVEADLLAFDVDPLSTVEA